MLKQKNNGWKKRIISMLLSVILIMSCLPADAFAFSLEDIPEVNEENGSEVGKQIFDQLTNPGIPEGYKDFSEDKKHPYGYGDGNKSTLKNPGLMIASSSGRDTNPSKMFMLGKNFYDFSKTNPPKGLFNNYHWKNSTISQNGDRMNEYAYIQAVSFDPDGDGLRNIIAYVGIQQKNYTVDMWSLNTDEGHNTSFENNFVSLGTVNWLKSVDLRITQDYIARNFISITAGDYDSDGKDTVVVYACTDGDSYKTREFSYESNQFQVVDSSNEHTMLNPAYNADTRLHDKKKDNGDTEEGLKLLGHVQTGDINNDGMDDLVVISEMGKPKYTTDVDQKACQAYIAVSFGKDSSSYHPLSQVDTSTYVEENGVSLTTAKSDIGNIFADGVNRLTVTGHKLTMGDDGKYIYTYNNYFRTSTFFYKIQNGKLVQSGKHFDNPFNEFLDAVGDECYASSVAVCSAHVNGLNTQEALFINGNVYSVEDDGNVKLVYKAFKEKADDSGEKAEHIYDAVPVSVDYNNYGIEQFGVSYFGNTNYTNSKCTLIYGDASYDSSGNLKPVSSNGYRQCIGQECDQGGRGFIGSNNNMLMVPFENDFDQAILVRLHEKGYYYSNPEPVAVLQAAPYFKETGSSYVGSTQYSLTASYTKGTGSTTNSSMGGGFVENFGVGILKQAFTYTYKNTISDDFKKSQKESVTTSFTATNNDTVIMQTTPVVYYSYDVYDNSSNEWKMNQMGITTALIPLYAQITVDQYNEFVKYHNDYADTHVKEYTYQGTKKELKTEHLNEIDKNAYKLGHIGDPGGYSDNWNDLPGGIRASKGFMSLGYIGGTTTNNYGYETSTTETHTTGWSLDCVLNAQVGGKFFNLFDFWVGPTFNKSQGSSTCSFVTKGNGYSISGSVKNLDADAITKSGQFSEDSVKAYNFSWTFGLSEFASHKRNNEDTEPKQIPVASYVVNSVTRGIAVPTITSLTETKENRLNLTWAPPATLEGQTIEGYRIYSCDLDGNYSKITEVSEDTLSYDYTPKDINRTDYYSFVVTAIGKSSTSHGKSLESFPSNKKSIVYNPGSDKETITVGIKEKSLTYGAKKSDLSISKEDLTFADEVDPSLINADQLEWTTTYEEGSPVGTYSITIKNLTSDKYLFNYAPGILSVNPKELTKENLQVSADDKVYDATTEAKGTILVKSGIIGNDSIKVGYDKAEFSDAKIGKDKVVNFSGLTLMGSKAANYNLSVENVEARASIIEAETVVWAAEGLNHKYDGSPKEIKARSLPECLTEVTYYRLDDDNKIVEYLATSPVKQGNYMYVITLRAGSNYSIRNACSKNDASLIGKQYEDLDYSNIGIMHIAKNQQPAFRFGEAIVQKTYGDAPFQHQPYGGNADAKLHYEITSGEDCVSLDEETGKVTITKSGMAIITATASSYGYEDVTASYVVNIEKKNVSIQIPERTTKTYTGQEISVPYTVQGDLPGRKIQSDEITFTYTNVKNGTDHSHVNVGEYYVIANIPVTNAYYMMDGEASGILNITAKPVTITPDRGQMKFVGEADPLFTYTVSVKEAMSEITGKLGRYPGEKVGEYAYHLGTLHSENYDLKIAAFAPTFTIIKKIKDEDQKPKEEILKCNVKTKNSGILVKWVKDPYASGYMIYATYCGKPLTKPVKTVSSLKTSAEISKIDGKKINPKKTYKIKVVSYTMIDGKKVVSRKSLNLCLPGKNNKYTAAKSITISSGKNLVLTTGKKSNIKASIKKINKKKNLISDKHCLRYRYASSATNVATVNKNGVITARGKGKCYIDVYAQNGINARITVTVR